ncbi:MAG: hypothetical protein HOF21_11120 [Nitrospina sp.]|jgi:hypothetical protein|nr:hypothetical protein [Nitrospina sp.]
MEIRKIRDTFQRAIHSMAVRPKSLQDRLIDAGREGLCRMKIEDMPTEEMKHDFREVSKTLIRLMEDCSVVNDRDARETANLIYSLYCEAQGELETAE